MYIYLISYIFVKYTIDLFTKKISISNYPLILKRLLLLIKILYHNKIVKINGKYKFQLYLPAFPTKAFFHSLEKFNPNNKEPGPITVVFSMTKACSYKCPHCYQNKDDGKELDLELLKQTARDMQDIGVSMFDIEGGEPLIRFKRLIELLKAFDNRAELWVNTTGYSLTKEKAIKMREAGVFGVMISLHSPNPTEYDKFTRIEGSFEIALKAMKIFQEVGITTVVNCCPSLKDVENNNLQKTFDLAKNNNCSFVQVIHGKSAGGWLDKKDKMIKSKNLISKLQYYHMNYNNKATYNSYPSISAQVFEESPQHLGCTAGGVDRFYLNHEGEVQPCEFLNVSFGNVNEEPFKVIFKRMRKYFKKPGVKWLCCTEAHSINKIYQDNKLQKTPLPKANTIDLVKSWDKGTETKLYRDLGIY
jgi:MoaA/NifB/PqqE/SkfB family radical SAM enzyme